MNAMVVDFSKKRIKQLKREIEDLEKIIIEFGGENEKCSESICPALVKDKQEEKRRHKVYWGFPGFCDNVLLGFAGSYSADR